MKVFKVLAFVCLFFFLIGCEEGATRFVPAEKDDSSSEITDDSDAVDPTNPTDDPTNPTDDPTNPTDDPTNPTDDPTNPTDDPTNPTDDVDPTDDEDPTDPTDDEDPTDPTDDDPTPDEDNPTPLTDAEKCANAGGTWSSWGQKCYRTETCDPKPANSEWNGNSSYKVYYDLNVEAWEPLTYPTHYGDGEPEICQYKCIANYAYLNGECKPYCSAVFDGESSKIQVEHNDLLNLASETWTIEAWIKQGEDDIPVYVIHPIIRKGITSDPAYVLSGYYKQQSGDGYGMTSYVKYSYREWNSTKTDNNRVDQTVTFSDDWTHVAMVKNKETTSSGWGQQTTTYKLLLFVNGTLVGSNDFENTPTVVTNNEALTIGANPVNAERYFKGLIDSIKISNTAKYTADFTPSVLSADNETIAFWDFNNNTNDASANALNGIGTNITYSTDCME